MIRFLQGFCNLQKVKEKFLLFKIKVNSDNREGVEFLNGNGVLRKPLDDEKVFILEDSEDKKYFILKSEGSTIPEVEKGEVVIFFDKDNYLKLTKNKKLNIQFGNKSLFDVLNKLIEQIKKNQTMTQLGLQTISPNSIIEMENIKNELAGVME